MVEIRQLGAPEAEKWIPDLARVLVDCVHGGASVGFLDHMSNSDAEQFFADSVSRVSEGERLLLAAFSGSDLLGTVQLVLKQPPNQQHRGDVAKLLVKRSARGQGVGQRLVQHVEQTAKEAGRSLLVLDTVVGDAGERLYARLGWNRVGAIPRYAVYPDGTWCDTAVFWKWLE